MAEKFNWKLFVLLVFGGSAASLMVLPFTFALVELPEEIPLALIVFAQTVQTAVILSISSALGLKLIGKTGLAGFPVLERRINREKLPFDAGYYFKEALIWGLAGGVLTIVLCIPYWDLSVKLLAEEMKVALWKSVLACFYGGVGEEIIFRLGMMTVLVWLFNKCRLKNGSYWLAIIITGIIFGLGHIGITSGMTEITFAVVSRAVLLNGSLSVIYGLLYWKRGLEAAMTAHFSTDLVLHVLIPHIIAPILM